MYILTRIYLQCKSWLELVFLQSEIRERRGWVRYWQPKIKSVTRNSGPTLISFNVGIDSWRDIMKINQKSCSCGHSARKLLNIPIVRNLDRFLQSINLLRLIIFVGIPFSSKDGLKMNANARLRTKQKHCYNYSPEKNFSLLIALAQISTFQPILQPFSKKGLVMAKNTKVLKSQYDSFSMKGCTLFYPLKRSENLMVF